MNYFVHSQKNASCQVSSLARVRNSSPVIITLQTLHHYKCTQKWTITFALWKWSYFATLSTLHLKLLWYNLLNVSQHHHVKTSLCVLFFRKSPDKFRFTTKLNLFLYFFEITILKDGSLKILAVVYLVSVVGSALRQLILKIKLCQRHLMTSSPFWFFTREKTQHLHCGILSSWLWENFLLCQRFCSRERKSFTICEDAAKIFILYYYYFFNYLW